MSAGRGLHRRIAWTAAGLFSVYVVSAVTLTIWKLEGPLVQPYCSERPPFAKPLSPWQAVFTAKVLYVGRVDRDYTVRSGHKVGLWALARVEHTYWGLGRVVRQPLGNSLEVAPGIKIEITGPAAPLLVGSDGKGVYDARGLPPGHYSLSAGPAELDWMASIAIQRDLKAGDVWGRTLLVK